MLLSLLFSAVLAIPVETPTGTISGRIAPPEKVSITRPVQVAVVSGEYVNLYLAELQKRVDNFWEEFKIAFIQDKQAFTLFRDRAERQALDSILNRMRMDNPRGAATLVQTTSNNNFEFRGVPQGECRVVAVVTIGNQEFVWRESVILTNEAPVFVTLKPTTP